MSTCRFLVDNSVVLPPSGTPPVTELLEAHPGAYTTTRTHNNGARVLFWEKHMHRLANSARILFNLKPNLLFKTEISAARFSSFAAQSSMWDVMIQSLVNDSMKKVLPVALKQRRSGEEIAITALVSGNSENITKNEVLNEEVFSRVFDVYVHVGVYVPLVFGIRGSGAHLAVVGRGRDIASAKYSDWVRLRKPLEKLRPHSVTELLLSNDGDRILEGCLTNFFVVCYKVKIEDICDAEGKNLYDYGSAVEIQTAPLSNGVLPGVIRQVVIEVCLTNGITLREVAPSWSERDMWEEAFVTNSLRILQYVQTIQVPKSWELLESKTCMDITWEEKLFKEGPGKITALIQKEIMQKTGLEALPVDMFSS